MDNFRGVWDKIGEFPRGPGKNEEFPRGQGENYLMHRYFRGVFSEVEYTYPRGQLKNRVFPKGFLQNEEFPRGLL